MYVEAGQGTGFQSNLCNLTYLISLYCNMYASRVSMYPRHTYPLHLNTHPPLPMAPNPHILSTRGGSPRMSTHRIVQYMIIFFCILFQQVGGILTDLPT